MDEGSIPDWIIEILYVPAAFGALVFVVVLVALLVCAILKVRRLISK